MPKHQGLEKNKNITKRNISNFVEFSMRHYVGVEASLLFA